MKTLIVATHNAHKLEEIRAILAELPYEVIGLRDLNFHEEIEEAGETFEANARLKAEVIRAHFPEAYVLSDDSGLAVDALDGAPGVYSARFMGEDTPYSIKMRALQEALEKTGSADRTARFVCCLCCLCPDGNRLEVRGEVVGEVAHEVSGKGGFGYDPMFYLVEEGCTMADLSAEEKNQRSHRYRALVALLEKLKAQV